EVAARRGLDALAHDAGSRLSLLAATLDATVERFRYLPTVLSQADVILDVLRDSSAERAEAASRYLHSLVNVSGATEIFIMAADGTTLAASNYRHHESFLGRNYAFRPYYKEGLYKSEGRYYAV